MWVSLLIPKIEDGNNFGVSVQEDTLAEIQQVEVEATNYLEQVSRYYVSRGKLISKVGIIKMQITIKIYFYKSFYHLICYLLCISSVKYVHLLNCLHCYLNILRRHYNMK